MNDLQKILDDVAGQPVAVVGAGKTGAAASIFLLNLGASVSLYDDAPAEKVIASLKKAGMDDAVLAKIQICAGGMQPESLLSSCLIALSPGVPRAHPALQAAISNGICIVNEIELALTKLPQCTCIGITGTNGKSTTTTMLGCIARSVDPHAFVGGNLGDPFCGVINAAKPSPSLAILELSSYQLETIHFLPLQSGIVTNLSPDHLDRYANAEEYYAAKAHLFDLIKSTGGMALNQSDATSEVFFSQWLANHPQAVSVSRLDFRFATQNDPKNTKPIVEIQADYRSLRVSWQGQEHTVSLDNPYIVGPHNAANAAAAVAAAALAGIAPQHWQAGIDAYRGIAHRLERVGTCAGVVWYNDSKATNVDAAATALRSFPVRAHGDGYVHLIVGGVGKGAPYQPLVDLSQGRIKAVYTIGADAPRLAAAFDGVVPVISAETLPQACRIIEEQGREGEILLLAPACASFDQFRDYQHRGETLRALFDEATARHTRI